MVKEYIDKLKNLDILIKKIMKSGFIFSFLITVISILILITYTIYYKSPDLYYIGIQLFKTSIIFFVSFIIGGIAFDTIIKQIR